MTGRSSWCSMMQHDSHLGKLLLSCLFIQRTYRVHGLVQLPARNTLIIYAVLRVSPPNQ